MIYVVNNNVYVTHQIKKKSCTVLKVIIIIFNKTNDDNYN